MPLNILENFPRGCGQELSAGGPSARFMTEEALRNRGGLGFDKRNMDGKFFLGVIGADIKVAPLQESRGRARRYAEPVGDDGKLIGVLDDRHIVTVAGSRSGKGRSAIIPNLLTYPGSMVVIDPKGDLARITAERRRRMGQTVHVLDPFNASGQSRGTSYNPLRELNIGSQTLVEDAGMIADAIIMKNENAKDPHWDESAFRLIETLVLHVATTPAYYLGRQDLVTVSKMLDRAHDLKIGEELRRNPAANGAVQAGANDFYGRPEQERSSVLSTARRHARFLSYENIQKILTDQESIDLAELKKSATTVYLVLPAMRMGTCSRWLRLFVNMTLAKMEEVREIPSFPVILCLDEFAVLGYMKSIEDAAGQLAGLGVKLWPILQDLTQLKALYGDRWETFLGNAGVLQFFGNSDYTTLDWISKRLGDTVVKHKSQNDLNYRGKVDGESGTSFSESVHPLMTPEEVSRFFGRDDKLLRQLVIRPSCEPIVLQRACYDKEFANLLNQ